MHVCSRWRYIALNSPTLWSHIDLQTDEPLLSGRWIVERAEAHATRAGQLPLDIHLPISFSQTGSAIIEDLSRLLSGPTISTRVHSLGVGFRGYSNSEDPILQPLSRLFENCQPGTLTKLAIHSKETRVGGLFIHGQGETRQPSEPTVISLDLPQDQLDAVLLGVTALQLRKIHFPWTSPAYHGLVELRLTGYLDCIFITESQLAGMLRASPRLRILEFGLIRIRRKSPEVAPVIPIQLTDLEALDLGLCFRSDLDFLFQWLAPGPKLVQLSIFCNYMHPTEKLVNSMELFLNRLSVKDLLLKYSEFTRALALVDALPNFQTLAIERLQRGPPVSNYKPRFGSCRLESLYLLTSVVDLDELVAFLDLCTTQTLVVWRTQVNGYTSHRERLPDDAILQELSKVCGEVRWLSESSLNPTKNSDPFWW